jgi:shikimate kinase
MSPRSRTVEIESGIQSERKTIVYLVGFMGAGKTEVGHRLAELLDWAFIDMDREIENRARLSILEIFSRYGETHFRQLERTELQRAAAKENTVVAAGGGAFCDVENQAVMLRTGITVWLDGPVELLFSRCSGDPDARPLFSGMAEMAKLLERRRPFYSRAHLHIQIGDADVNALAETILQKL